MSEVPPKCTRCGRKDCAAMKRHDIALIDLGNKQVCYRRTIRRLVASAGAGWHAARDAHRSIGDASAELVDNAALKEIEELARMFE